MDGTEAWISGVNSGSSYRRNNEEWKLNRDQFNQRKRNDNNRLLEEFGDDAVVTPDGHVDIVGSSAKRRARFDRDRLTAAGATASAFDSQFDQPMLQAVENRKNQTPQAPAVLEKPPVEPARKFSESIIGDPQPQAMPVPARYDAPSLAAGFGEDISPPVRRPSVRQAAPVQEDHLVPQALEREDSAAPSPPRIMRDPRTYFGQDSAWGPSQEEQLLGGSSLRRSDVAAQLAAAPAPDLPNVPTELHQQAAELAAQHVEAAPVIPENAPMDVKRKVAAGLLASLTPEQRANPAFMESYVKAIIPAMKEKRMAAEEDRRMRSMENSEEAKAVTLFSENVVRKPNGDIDYAASSAKFKKSKDEDELMTSLGKSAAADGETPTAAQRKNSNFMKGYATTREKLAPTEMRTDTQLTVAEIRAESASRVAAQRATERRDGLLFRMQQQQPKAISLEAADKEIVNSYARSVANKTIGGQMMKDALEIMDDPNTSPALAYSTALGKFKDLNSVEWKSDAVSEQEAKRLGDLLELNLNPVKIVFQKRIFPDMGEFKNLLRNKVKTLDKESEILEGKIQGVYSKYHADYNNPRPMGPGAASSGGASGATPTAHPTNTFTIDGIKITKRP